MAHHSHYVFRVLFGIASSILFGLSMVTFGYDATPEEQAQLQQLYAAFDRHIAVTQVDPALYVAAIDRLKHSEKFDQYTEQRQYIIIAVRDYLFETYVDQPAFDLWSDDSIHKFVGLDHSYSDLSYEPRDLVQLVSSDTLSPTKHEMSVSYRIYHPLLALARDYTDATGRPLIITSAYRSYSYQSRISASCKGRGRCAREGHSEHQSGLAIDLGAMSGYPYERMRDHAHRYGFHQSYQKGITTDGYHAENRHRRYLGVELATLLHEEGLTFTERVSMQ